MTGTTTRTTTLLAVGAVVAAVAAGVLVAAWAGAGGGDDSANGSVPVGDVGELTGSWRAVNAVGAPHEVVGEVRLQVESDRLLVETGCNTGRGTVEVVDSHLVAGPLATTRMACEPALMEQERWVTEMLGSRPRLELSGPYLALHWGDDERWWLGLEQEGQGESTPAS
jgi:heat shock protein HslJ